MSDNVNVGQLLWLSVFETWMEREHPSAPKEFGYINLGCAKAMWIAAIDAACLTQRDSSEDYIYDRIRELKP